VPSSKAHIVVRVEADGARKSRHRAVQGARLHGIGIIVIPIGVELDFGARRIDHELFVLWQFYFAAVTTIRIAGFSLSAVKSSTEGGIGGRPDQSSC
jgi:hypothetical protein